MSEMLPKSSKDELNSATCSLSCHTIHVLNHFFVRLIELEKEFRALQTDLQDLKDVSRWHNDTAIYHAVYLLFGIIGT